MTYIKCNVCGKFTEFNENVLGRCYKCAGKTKAEAKKFNNNYHGNWRRFI